MVYEGLEPMTVLAAAAAVTSQVGLVTMVVIGPLRSTAILAKQASTIDRLSQGRLTLGLSIGARRDDYDACGVEYRTRGRVLSQQLAELRDRWEMMGSDPDLLVGGGSDASLLRMASHADGYVHGGGPPRGFGSAASRVLTAWEDAGRSGRPQLWAQAYFALGDEELGNAYLRSYYAFTGAFADKVAAANLTTPTAIKDYLAGYEEVGCDELVLLPTVSDLSQLDRLTELLN